MSKPVKIVVVGGGAAGWMTAGTIAAEHDARVGGVEVSSSSRPTWRDWRRRGYLADHAHDPGPAGYLRDRLYSGVRCVVQAGYAFRRLAHRRRRRPLLPSFHVAARLREDQSRPRWLESATVCHSPTQSACRASSARAGWHRSKARRRSTLLLPTTAITSTPASSRRCCKSTAQRYLASTYSRSRNRHQCCGQWRHRLTRQQAAWRNRGDLFVDCTGFSSLLLGKHYGVPFVSRKHNLFIDTALAVQVPYASRTARSSRRRFRRHKEPAGSGTSGCRRAAAWATSIPAHTTEDRPKPNCDLT